jgi:hypothetical protein
MTPRRGLRVIAARAHSSVASARAPLSPALCFLPFRIIRSAFLTLLSSLPSADVKQQYAATPKQTPASAMTITISLHPWRYIFDSARFTETT